VSRYTIQHPKYELNRYSTRQLYAFLEESVLVVECLLKRRKTHVRPRSEWELILEAGRIKRDVWEALRERDEPIAKMARVVRLIKEDVHS